VRFDEYWDSGKPYLDAVSFRFMPDPAVQMANLRSGEVNFVHDLHVSLVDQAEGIDGSAPVEAGLFFHWWQPQLLEGPLATKEARQALRFLFDREALNTIAWGGRGIDTWNPYDQTPYGIGATVDVTFDVEEGKKRLAAAGIEGAEIPLNVLEGSPFSTNEAQVLQQSFVEAGLNTEIVPEDVNTWLGHLFNDRDHKGISNNYGPVPYPFLTIASYMLTPTALPFPPDHPDAPIPALYDAFVAAQNAIEEDEYRQRLEDLQEIMLDEVPAFPTLMAHNYQVAPTNLEGLYANKIGDVLFNDAHFV
jgi:ABC-type transport system substrate-binding protein